MKKKKVFGLISDTHLEEYNVFTNGSNKSFESFSDFFKINPPKEKLDVLIVAGDFCEFKLKDVWEYGVKKIEDYADLILFVPGNHEYWRGHLQKFSEYKDFVESLSPKVKVLNNEEVIVDDVSLFFSTLWTNYGKSEYVMYEASAKYSSLAKDKNIVKIKKNFRKPKAIDFVIESNKSKTHIEKWLNKTSNTFRNKRILVSHYPALEDKVNLGYLFKDEKDEDARLEKIKLANLMEYTDLTDSLQLHSDVVLVHGHLHGVKEKYISNNSLNTVYANPKGIIDNKEDYDIMIFEV